MNRRESGLVGLARERAATTNAASSSSAIGASSGWRTCLVCTEPNPKNPASVHAKYWTVTYEEAVATLTFTWGSLNSPRTNQLTLSFGCLHGALASAFGENRCATKLRGTKTKAAYRELLEDEVLELPTLPYQRVGLKLNGVQPASESFEFDFEPESDDEDEDNETLGQMLCEMLEGTGL